MISQLFDYLWSLRFCQRYDYLSFLVHDVVYSGRETQSFLSAYERQDENERNIRYVIASPQAYPAQWRTEVFKPPLTSEIPKELQNCAKLDPIVKTVKNYWI